MRCGRVPGYERIGPGAVLPVELRAGHGDEHHDDGDERLKTGADDGAKPVERYGGEQDASLSRKRGRGLWFRYSGPGVVRMSAVYEG